MWVCTPRTYTMAGVPGHLTIDERRTQMQVLCDLRELGRNAFVVQTQAQMHRQPYDADIAITEIFLKPFRDVGPERVSSTSTAAPAI